MFNSMASTGQKPQKTINICTLARSMSHFSLDTTNTVMNRALPYTQRKLVSTLFPISVVY